MQLLHGAASANAAEPITSSDSVAQDPAIIYQGRAANSRLNWRLDHVPLLKLRFGLDFEMIIENLVVVRRRTTKKCILPWRGRPRSKITKD